MAKDRFYEALTPVVSITLALPGSTLQAAILATNAIESAAELAGLCCDGTGNEIEGNLSNVLKLYRIARRDEEQRVYYDLGIRALTDASWTLLRLASIIPATVDQPIAAPAPM
jgi:hypothetical protein